MTRRIVTVNGEAMTLPRHVDMRGMLQFLILWELSDGPLHGRAIARRIGNRRGDAPNPGTLYPALANLTEAGLLTRREEGRRIAYILTDEGRAELEAAVRFFRAAYRDIAGDDTTGASDPRGGLPGL